MRILPAPMGAVTVMGEGACIEEASMVVVDYPGAKIWDVRLQTVVDPSVWESPLANRSCTGNVPDAGDARSVS
jgi:hypothetical protein